MSIRITAGGNLELVLKTPMRRAFKMVLERLAENANKAFGRMQRSLFRELRGPIASSIMNSAEMKSLSGGKLQGDLGLRNSEARLSPKLITDAVVNSLSTRFIPVRVSGPSLVGGQLTLGTCWG